MISQELPREVSAIPRDLVEDRLVNQVLDCTEQFLEESRWLRELAALKNSEGMTVGRFYPLKKIKKILRIAKRMFKDVATDKGKDCNKTEGIDVSEISRRKAAGEWLRCAWPGDRKGNHRVKDCRRRIKLDQGTALFPKDRNYQKPTESSEEE